jgi:hypothetical protein
LTVQRERLKTGIFIALLVLTFIFAASLFQDAKAATQPSTPTPSPATTSELPPYPMNTATGRIEFGNPVIGKECSDVLSAKTITLCNYTTPQHFGKIVQISIYLAGISGGSNVQAVIFANEPDVNFPKGGEPIVKSLETLNVASVSGQWYNFTMNCSASANTIYWLGYYSDGQTHYFFDASNNSITVTSQPKDGNSSWLPVGWSYQGKTTLSLYALYTISDPTPTATPTNSGIQQSTQSSDAIFVSLIIVGETTIVATGKARKKNSINKQ